MGNIHNNMQKHLFFMENIISFRSFSKKNLYEWAKPMCDAIDDDGSISYLVSNKERYRASPLASTIIWLSRENLITNDVLDKMQEELLYLRDNAKLNDPSTGCNNKHMEDFDGWSLSEGVSVWSTSMAIIALSDNSGNGFSKASKYKNSIVWLANQRNAEKKGWGYQNTENCSVNVIMTALATRALAKCFTEDAQKIFNYSTEEKTLIRTSIVKGTEYLVDACKLNKKYAYWEFNGKPSCAATTWSLMALKESYYIVADNIKKFTNNNTKKGLLFVLSKMPSNIKKWEEEKIVEETGAKYDSQKNYYSFSATLIPELILLGVSPLHTKVVKQIQWIVDNENDWKTKYDNRDTCSFTYAMLIATIVCWIRHVGCVNATQLLNGSTNYFYRVIEKLLGYPLGDNSPVIFIEKKKLIVSTLTVLSLIVFVVFRNHIVSAVKFLMGYIPFLNDNLDSIVINIISSILYAILCFILAKLLSALKKLFRINEGNNL